MATVGSEECAFCQLVADVGKCHLLADTADAMAFMDIHPANPGHCLVIPKAHRPTLFDVTPDEFAAVARLVVRVAAGVEAALRPPGLSIVQANRGAANQTVPHLHVHILPRQEGDGLLLNWPRTNAGDSTEIARLATRIRDHIPRV
jgi:histidine triad (HIT) family protein